MFRDECSISDLFSAFRDFGFSLMGVDRPEALSEARDELRLTRGERLGDTTGVSSSDSSGLSLNVYISTQVPLKLHLSTDSVIFCKKSDWAKSIFRSP